jgi:hypothetical protein
MSWLKRILIALAGVVAVAVILFVDYYLPSTTLVRITGHEVKRMDTGRDSSTGQDITRDVRFMYAKGTEDGNDYAFRNEDTGWGWPPYFKFDSGDLAAKANNISATEPEATALVTYYGWRITYLDMYPNMVDLRVVEPGYTHIPVLKILLLALIIGVVGYGVYWFRWGRYKSWLKKEGSAREG